ncbi:DUF5765 domain-containing protein [Roseibium sp.]|uniref:DUF5765 domain-containing protein n=1 Tax=Roseibium sp. TaxID=1936156 RepID=UPI003A97CECB
MCWSEGATLTMVAAGAAGTGYCLHKRMPPAIWATVGYFTLMEGLQAIGYRYVDACGSPANQTVTLLSFLHIAFQPFFINAFAMELVPHEVRRNVRGWVFAACFFSTIFMLVQLYPMDWAGLCREGQPLCGPALCLISGDWHIGWELPFNGLTVPFDDLVGMNVGFPTYLMAAFLVPLLYGSWRFVMFHALVGPFLAYQLTDNLNEMPAVWCLFSIGILAIALVPKFFAWTSVSRWFGWPVSWREPRVS